jgi:hypothetical protein
MPGFDATGPQGAGPGTGWGRGRCRAKVRQVGGGGPGQPGGDPQAISLSCPRWGRRLNSRPGGSAGRYEAADQEVQQLTARETYLRQELETIQKRLAEMDKQK